MKRYVCIHGHFYQPPRENPWLEAIELNMRKAPDRYDEILQPLYDRFRKSPPRGG